MSSELIRQAVALIRNTTQQGDEIFIEASGGITDENIKSYLDTGINAIEWMQKLQKLGAGEIFVNSIDADGTKDGYDIPLTKSVCDLVSTPVIASSGCGSPQHMYDVFVNAGANAALAASIFQIIWRVLSASAGPASPSGRMAKWYIPD